MRLNPNDNQGIRYILINCLLTEGMEEPAASLLSEYNEPSCFMLYSKALLLFRKSGGTTTDDCLEQAIESNSNAPLYLLKQKHIPWLLPSSYSWGSEEEAVIYADMACEAWENTHGALAWLAAEFEKINT